ncbi:cupin-like domain-containing protein [Streptomyces tibetensis]|uniref:cupin-like domain-containing protein n=1 Tax=Streptomyces tibetensis TaxID=2382123 RepID=UPI0038240918
MAPISPTPLRVLDGSAVTTLEDLDGPVVIRGLQDEWPARELWTVEHFRDQYGGLRVPVREYPAGSEYEYTIADGGLAEFLEYWEKIPMDGSLARDRRYLAEWNFVRDCPELLDDFSVPAIFSEDWIDRLPEQVRFGRMWIFFGEPGCSTGLHCDTFSTSAWLAVLDGSKELRLVTPETGRALRADDSLWSERTHDEVLRKSTDPLYEVTLRAGDTLYIPGDWYHEVRNPERNLMLTANFVEERKLLSFLAQFETRLTEPLSILRQARNARIRTWAGGAGRHDELARPEFRARQLDWVRGMTSELREYERALLDWDATDTGATEAPSGAR